MANIYTSMGDLEKAKQFYMVRPMQPSFTYKLSINKFSVNARTSVDLWTCNPATNGNSVREKVTTINGFPLQDMGYWCSLQDPYFDAVRKDPLPSFNNFVWSRILEIFFKCCTTKFFFISFEKKWETYTKLCCCHVINIGNDLWYKRLLV